MECWSTFFASQVGAAATLAGLLFVSVSVNRARILSLGRMADRGAEALSMLFLALVAASLPFLMFCGIGTSTWALLVEINR